MKNLKRFLAIFALIILAGGILTICVMLFNSKNFSDATFKGLVSCLIALPIVAYGYSLLVKYAAKYRNKVQDEISKIEDEAK